MAASTDERALVVDNRMAGCEAEPTSERLTDDAIEWRVVVGCRPLPAITGWRRPRGGKRLGSTPGLRPGISHAW